MQDQNIFSSINLFPGFLSKTNASKNAKNKKLVIIQLSGGNDGLNSIIPVRNDIYYKKRPKISIKKQKAIAANDEFSFNTALKSLANIYNKGYLSIINSVGYPNTNRSHFRSMDIWHSAILDQKNQNTGWLGRYLDANCKQSNNMFGAVEMNDLLSLALKGTICNGVAFDNFKELRDDFDAVNVKAQLQKVENDAFKSNENLSYIYNLLYKGNLDLEPMRNKLSKTKYKLPFPKTKIGKDLRRTAKMILSDVDTQIFYITHGSFDTHANQLNTHKTLLQNFAEATEAFVNLMEKQNKFDEVCIMVFSEFGRRVSENGSAGTDHGGGNCLFLISPHFKKAGMFNKMNSLQKLVNGDLGFEIDFRRVYATLVEDWLNTDSKDVLLSNYKKLDLFNPFG